MVKSNKYYSNIVALAREDAREYRIVNGKNSDVLSQRLYYRVVAWLKIIGFAVFAAMSLLFVFGAINELMGVDSIVAPAEEKANAINELYQAIIAVSVCLGVGSVGFVLTFLRKGDNTRPVLNIIGAVVLTACCAVVASFLFFAAKESVNYFDGGKERFIWCFAIPAVVVGFSSLFQSIFGAVDTGADKARYNAVLEEAFEKFVDGRQGGTYTEQEWEEFVVSYKRDPRPDPVKKTKK